jgi:hypothetical protein
MNKTLTGFILTGTVDKIVREGSPKEVAAVVKEYALSYPLLRMAKARKDLSKATYSKIRADIKSIHDGLKELTDFGMGAI